MPKNPWNGQGVDSAYYTLHYTFRAVKMPQNSRTCAFIQTYKDGLKGELFNWIAGIRKTITLTSEGTSKLVNMNFRGKGIGIFGGVIGQNSKWKYAKSFLNFVRH